MSLLLTLQDKLDLKAPLVSPTFTTPTLGAATGTSLQLSGLTMSQILSADASKNLVSLDVATYPSLTELSYVKGLSSAIQTQLGLKAPLASPTFTGTVTLPKVISMETGGDTVSLSLTDDSNALALHGGGTTAGHAARVWIEGFDRGYGGSARIILSTPNAAESATVDRLTITGKADTAVFEVSNSYVKLNLPTSNPGAGILWNDSGTVKVGT